MEGCLCVSILASFACHKNAAVDFFFIFCVPHLFNCHIIRVKGSAIYDRTVCQGNMFVILPVFAKFDDEIISYVVRYIFNHCHFFVKLQQLFPLSKTFKSTIRCGFKSPF